MTRLLSPMAASCATSTRYKNKIGPVETWNPIIGIAIAVNTR